MHLQTAKMLMFFYGRELLTNRLPYFSQNTFTTNLDCHTLILDFISIMKGLKLPLLLMTEQLNRERCKL
jgi:hypothetical protein